MRKIARFMRDRIEGAVFLFLFIPWILLAIPCSVLGRSGHVFFASIHRWASRMVKGLSGFRADSWVLWKYEQKRDIWFHILVMELFAALNLARRESFSTELPPNARVLVLKLAHFGDALHILPMLNGLHRARRDVRIDLVVGPWCSFLAEKAQAVSSTFEYVPRYTLFNRGQRARIRSFWDELRFLFHLRRQRYDLLISTSTTNLPELLLIQGTAARLWLGCSTRLTQEYSELPAKLVPYDSRMYEAERVCSLLELIGVKIPKGEQSLVFPISAQTEDWALARKREWLQGLSRPLIAISPGAGWLGKIWPAECFVELIRCLHDRLNALVVLLGAPSEREVTGAIAMGAGPGSVDLGGQTSLDQLAAIIAQADLFVGNDSGPMHVAAAMRTPSVVLFGPTVASKWAPRGPQFRVLQSDFDCSRCISWHPLTTCTQANACMKEIKVETVYSAAAELLALYRN